MKIVISPAKTLDFESPVPTSEYTEIQFTEEASRINKVLSAKKPITLKKLMDISEPLAALNWQRNQEFGLPFTPDNARQAIFAFSGDVYQGLDPYTLTAPEIVLMQDQLRILSGLYGILKPLDLIMPYRLEMGTKLKVGSASNLYEFWKKKLTSQLNSELLPGEILVNLASVEYFNAIDSKKLNAKIITPVFKDWSKDKLKVISFFAKKARGLMVRHLLEQGAVRIEDLLTFTKEGYRYSEEHTQREDQPVFIR
jgi:cytoplasmic iron level regulating protein YaaA (DUF328/UPF0246 family)